MGEKTGIAWCSHTFNPWMGCTKVSPGCANCYAEKSPAVTFKGIGWGPGAPRVRTVESYWRQPLKWNRAAERDGVRRRVFCASLADWLDDAVPAQWLADLLGLIYATPHLDWLLLSKRPETWRQRLLAAAECFASTAIPGPIVARQWLAGQAPANVWIGTTVEDDERKRRAFELSRIPARIRFLSMEPLLALPGQLDLRGIDWVIVGGESGPRARPFNVAWARTIIEWCRAIGAVPFVKQMGAVPLARDYLPPMNSDDALETLGMAPVSRADVRSDGPMREWPDGTHFGNRTGKLELNGRVALMKDGHGADPLEWPEDLRVQEFPAAQENPNA